MINASYLIHHFASATPALRTGEFRQAAAESNEALVRDLAGSDSGIAFSGLTEVIPMAIDRRYPFLGRHLKKEPTPPDPRCHFRHHLVSGRFFRSTPGH